MAIFRPLPDAPGMDDDDDEVDAWELGATMPEYREWRRTDVITVSMRVKWWWRRTRRVLR
ncbi:hypothetical protein [Curtobacterium sp. 1544]|jgi:hypothetical protein|uniref:hypothetical protein n=1 Tax=Curtobacterium sp. 1544 TaxID=3156417 RepID=UPI003395C9C5